MANPNPADLSKKLFFITMIGAVLYVGAAFVFVILGETEGARVEQQASSTEVVK